MPTPTYPYQSITIHPPDENGAREVWGEYKETMAGRTFDSDGIIGWLYYPPSNDGSNTWVWLNEAGHPTRVCGEYNHYLEAWLHTLSPIVTWSDTART